MGGYGYPLQPVGESVETKRNRLGALLQTLHHFNFSLIFFFFFFWSTDFIDFSLLEFWEMSLLALGFLFKSFCFSVLFKSLCFSGSLILKQLNSQCLEKSVFSRPGVLRAFYRKHLMSLEGPVLSDGRMY